MTLLPRSLFSRLVLVLLAGLVVAQLLSFAIHMHERGQLLLEASGMQSAQRIADIVRLLEPLPPAERRRMASILSAPPMTIKLDQAALIPVAKDRTARAALFGAFLRRSLGDAWPLEVVVADSGAFTPGATRGPPGFHMGGDPRGGGMPFHPAMQYLSQPALSFVAQVRLHDGTLVTFD
jgi:hypothetical protein